jgi:hypothetical protein
MASRSCANRSSINRVNPCFLSLQRSPPLLSVYNRRRNLRRTSACRRRGELPDWSKPPTYCFSYHSRNASSISCWILGGRAAGPTKPGESAFRHSRGLRDVGSSCATDRGYAIPLSVAHTQKCKAPRKNATLYKKANIETRITTVCHSPRAGCQANDVRSAPAHGVNRGKSLRTFLQ